MPLEMKAASAIRAALIAVVDDQAEALLAEVLPRAQWADDGRVTVEFLAGDSARIYLRLRGSGRGQQVTRLSWSTLVRLEEGTAAELYAKFVTGVRERLLPLPATPSAD